MVEHSLCQFDFSACTIPDVVNSSKLEIVRFYTRIAGKYSVKTGICQLKFGEGVEDGNRIVRISNILILQVVSFRHWQAGADSRQ